MKRTNSVKAHKLVEGFIGRYFRPMFTNSRILNSRNPGRTIYDLIYYHGRYGHPHHINELIKKLKSNNIKVGKTNFSTEEKTREWYANIISLNATRMLKRRYETQRKRERERRRKEMLRNKRGRR